MLPHQLLFFRPHFLIFGQLSIIVGLLWVACARQKAPTKPSKAETMHCWETVKQSAGQWPHKYNILVHRGLLHLSWNQTRLVLMVSVVLVELVRLSGAATISLPPTPPPAPMFSCSDRPAPSSVLLGTYSAIQLSHSYAVGRARIFSL